MEINPDIRPVVAALIQADRRTGGWTDMTKLLGASRFVRRQFSITRHAVRPRSKYITEMAVFSKQNSTPPKFPHCCKADSWTLTRPFNITHLLYNYPADRYVYYIINFLRQRLEIFKAKHFKYHQSLTSVWNGHHYQ